MIDELEYVMIDELIARAEELGLPEVAAVLTFTKDNGTDRTIGLLAAVDRHANAGLVHSLKTRGPLSKAVASFKDGRWATTDPRPWLVLNDMRDKVVATIRANLAHANRS